MCSPLVLVFALLASSVLSAASSGEMIDGIDLNSLSEEYVHRTATHGFKNQILPQVGRMLRQEESQCDCVTLRQNIYNESRRIWFMNEMTLSLINDHIQCAVDCVEDSDTIILSNNGTIQPENTIIINKSITISGFHDQELGASDDTYPAAKKKTVITCPENSTQAIFSIKSGGVIIANLEIRDCLNPENAAPVVIGECNNNTDGVKIHHVDFMNNSGSSHPVTIDILSTSSSCGVLEIMDVSFRDNKAGYNTAFVKLRSTTVMRDIRIRNNQRIKDTAQGVKLVQFTTTEEQNDSLTIDNLVAIGNSVQILEANSGVVNISNSVFTENEAKTDGRSSTQDSSMILFSSVSKAVIRDCWFRDNVGGGHTIILSDNVTSLKILNSAFSQNSEFGSIIFSTQSKVKIRDSEMVLNIGTLNGGVLHLDNSTVNVSRSTFFDNMSEEKGGVVYATNNSNIEVRSSQFLKNTAQHGGCFYIEESDVTIIDSLFRKNKASADGGAIFLKRGGVTCNSSSFTHNTALDNGGAFNIETATQVVWNSVTFSFNGAAFGSAVHIINSRQRVEWNDVVFEHAEARLRGAAAHIDDAVVIITRAFFQNNTAPSGGAIYAQAFNIIIKDARFKNNDALVMGGAIAGDNGTITFGNTSFIENSSTLGGALHVYNTTFTASEISFENNTASEGAGLLCKESNISIEPRTNATSMIPSSAVAQLNTSFGIFAVNNTGMDSGGVISAKVSNVTISYGRFKNNNAPEGGAIQVTSTKNRTFEVSDSLFDGNMVDVRGGSISARASGGNLSITLTSTEFKECIADHGGAIFFTSVNTVIENCTFTSNNVAGDGGAAVIQKSRTVLSEGENFTNRAITPEINVEIKNCKFNGNKAGNRGGAVMLFGELVVNRTLIINEDAQKGLSYEKHGFNVKMESVNYTLNRAYFEGAAINGRAVNLTTHNITVNNNRAPVGGGIHLREAFFHISNSRVENNTGKNRGGGIDVIRDSDGTVISTWIQGNQITENGYGGGISVSNSSVIFCYIHVQKNSATIGGGLHLSQTTFNICDSDILNNEAESSGGGIKVTQMSDGTISSTEIINNRIKKEGEGGGMSISGSTVKGRNLSVEGNHATFGGGVSLVLVTERDPIVKQQDAGSKFLCLHCSFKNNKALTSGGGLNIDHQNSKITVISQLENCTFKDNSAEVFGGSIHYDNLVHHLEIKNETSNGYLVILNSSFTNNTAGRSGGSLYSFNSHRVFVNCPLSTHNTHGFDFLTEIKAERRLKDLVQCPQWREKVNKNNSPGVSSYVKICNATVESKNDCNWSWINSSSIAINGTVPGERLPDIMVKCYDQFNAIAKYRRYGFTATLKSRDEGYLEGIFVTNLTDGSGNFTGVRNPSNGDTFWKNYTYELKISFSLDYVLPITIQMNVRECRINEEKESEGVLCKQCDATQYNFDPMIKTCKPCDSTLDCSGTFVRPREDYWNASPCHVPAKKCLTAYACRSPVDIDEKLTTFEYKNISSALGNYSCKISDEAGKEYRKLLCKEGYKGVLCGSCKADYGRSLSFACTKCNGAGFSVLILGSVCVWLAAIAAITIRGSMTIEERLSVIRKQLIDLAARNAHRIIESLSEEDVKEEKERTSNKERDDTVKDKSEKVLSSTRKCCKHMISGLSRSTNASCWVGCNLSTNTINITKETPEKINNLRMAQLAKWKLVEVFKVTINFLQAIAIAAVINVEWTRYMLTLFDMSAFAGGASTSLLTRAIHCLFWWNGTKHAAYAGLISGLLVPIFVILCIFAFFAFLTYKSSKGMYYFVKRSVLATLAISYFSYLSITKAAVMFFYCIGVHTDDDHFSTEEKYYWALDTSIQCSASYHKKFMVFGGILFALFSVGFPLGSAIVLALSRKDSGQKDPQWMSDILGFLYRAYRRKFVYWESTVMLRKALLSVIAVFSYHLGGHTQGLLASSILSVCLFFQAICKPYRHEFETVNNHESLSLLVSGITFTLAQFFTKDRTNDSVKISLNVLLMIAIIGFLLYMIVSMLICLLDVIRADLKVLGQLADVDDDNENSWSVVITWVAQRLGFSERPGDGNDDVELGSIKSKKLTIDNDAVKYGP